MIWNWFLCSKFYEPQQFRSAINFSVASVSWLTKYNFSFVSQELHSVSDGPKKKSDSFAQFECFKLVLLTCQTRKNVLINAHCIHYAPFDVYKREEERGGIEPQRVTWSVRMWLINGCAKLNRYIHYFILWSVWECVYTSSAKLWELRERDEEKLVLDGAFAAKWDFT